MDFPRLFAKWPAGLKRQHDLCLRVSFRFQFPCIPGGNDFDGSVGARYPRVSQSQQHHGDPEDCRDSRLRHSRRALYPPHQLASGSPTLHWIRLGVLFGAMMGMISSLLVFQLGQARVWFAMSRDGLLPKLFGKVHPRFRTPSTATWIAGFVVGIPAGILDIGT